ncbi:MAG: DUF6978 family protein [Maioricimonas sp. JB049]
MTQEEFEELIGDESKRVDENIQWREDEDHSPALEFRVRVDSQAGYPLDVKGSFNLHAKTLSYVLIHTGVGRIYALDLGKSHRNPDGTQLGEKHKHCWNQDLRDKEAYVPDDITAPVSDPVTVWKQFCAEAKITHAGRMVPPRMERQGELFS